MNQSTLKPDQVISNLNNLIEINRDGQSGFKESAEKIAATQIRQFCFEHSRTHAQFVGELQPLVLSLGSEPDNKGTVLGDLHRVWIDLKSAMGGGDHAILVATESAVDQAISGYKKALDEPLPAYMRDIVERQLQGIEQAHSKVRQMREALAQ